MKSLSSCRWINPVQRAILMSYADGEFSYLLHCPNEEAWHCGIYTCGDGLLRFLLIDPSYREDCHCRMDAIARVEMAIRQLNALLEMAGELPDWSTERRHLVAAEAGCSFSDQSWPFILAAASDVSPVFTASPAPIQHSFHINAIRLVGGANTSAPWSQT